VKNVFIGVFVSLVITLASCGGGSNIAVHAQPWEDVTIEVAETVVPATDDCPEYTVVERTQYCLSKFDLDKDGYYILFDGKTLNGWRGYNRNDIPSRWSVDKAENAIKFTGVIEGETVEKGSKGDLIFGRKFKNFEFSIDWKISKGGNSGVMYLGKEIKGKPSYISAPECQVLDNENHPDAKLGINGNRKSSSLYDMIPAVPQNAKPYGEWNNTTIIVDNGNVSHFQNGEKVLSYTLWTPEWIELLQGCKFSHDKNPLAFELLSNVGGTNREGYITLQDHNNDVWFRNIKIKILD